MARDVSVTDLALSPRLDSVIRKLELLYEKMDKSYAQAASHYGFVCTGCEDNCCLTRFYHHTFLEYIFLRKGFDQLPETVQKEARYRALEYDKALTRARESKTGVSFRVMCPLNQNGLCLIYDFRPMICRLHGIPHELKPPGRQKVVFSQGCPQFDLSCGHLQYYPFDRTPFYTSMSMLESKLKENLGIAVKTKKTVAQMIIHDLVGINEIS
jgi:Fe-S-cluster containining protein